MSRKALFEATLYNVFIYACLDRLFVMKALNTVIFRDLIVLERIFYKAKSLFVETEVSISRWVQCKDLMTNASNSLLRANLLNNFLIL